MGKPLDYTVDAGDLRHRITMQQLPLPEQVDGAGQPLEGWQPVEDRWAAIQQLTGAELVFAGQVIADATHMLTIYVPDRYEVTPKMRAMFKGRAFGFIRVENVNEVGAKMRIWAKEQVA